MPVGHFNAKGTRSRKTSSEGQINTEAPEVVLPSDSTDVLSVTQLGKPGVVLEAELNDVGEVSPRISRRKSVGISPRETVVLPSNSRRASDNIRGSVHQNEGSSTHSRSSAMPPIESRRGSRVAEPSLEMSRRRTAGDIGVKSTRRGSNVEFNSQGKRLSLKPELEDTRVRGWRRASAFTGVLGMASFLPRGSGSVSHETEKEPIIPKYKLKTLGRLVIVLSRMLKFHMQACDKKGCFAEQFNQIDGAASLGIEKNSDLFFDPSEFKANKQMRMTAEAKRILTKRPEDRTEAEINYAMIALRGNKLIADYPVRFQRKLAQNGSFECYDSTRVIVRQGHPPQAFYFIMYGTVIVAVLQQNEEQAVTACYLSRGDSFGELAIRNNETRASTVITKNYVEMLSISAQTYQKVFMVGGSKNINDPDHNEFISSIEFLRGWPISLLENNPKKFVFTYFKRGAVMVKDSNYSDWIYIVKSGSVQVLKKLIRTMPKIDSFTGKTINRPPLTSKDGYVAFMSDKYEDCRGAEDGKDAVEKAIESIRRENTAMKSSSRKSKKPRPNSDGSRTRPNTGEDYRRVKSAGKTSRDSTMGKVTFSESTKDPAEDITKVVSSVTNAKRVAKQGVDLFRKRKKRRAVDERYRKKVIASDDQEDGNKNPDFKEQRRTFLDDLDSAYKDRQHVVTEADLNPQFVKVQTLTKGSVFGLAQVVFFNDKQPSFCLVSNGAECLMLNKQFFRDNCPVELSRKLLKTVSPYPTDHDMQDKLLTRLNWDALRQATLTQVMTDIQGLKLRHYHVNPYLSIR